jgi:hypothetical protein
MVAQQHQQQQQHLQRQQQQRRVKLCSLASPQMIPELGRA